VRVLVVAEFYPRAADPVLGVWAHRQALAARDAGADVRVAVLYRPIPPKADMTWRTARRALSQPPHAVLDGLDVDYVPFVSPPRGRTYGSWGAWATPSLAVYLRTAARRHRPQLVHAHNAVPAGDAVRRAGGQRYVVSVHGSDVFHTAPLHSAGASAVRRTFGEAALVIANSHGIARRCTQLGARESTVVRLGTDIPEPVARDPRTLVSVAHLIARKRHADVLRAMWMLRDRVPDLRYVVIGDGPERAALEALTTELELSRRVEFTGQLDPAAALERARRAGLFVLPSTDEAFGVAYVEAMAGGLPALGCRGEPGPEDIAAAGDGLRLVAPGDVEALAAEIEALIGEPRYLADLGDRARATVIRNYSWPACGRATVAAYEEALR
jgi:teichuronic acid biosynthesis glycosyltransferase TuaC